jgi:hypothetical protein
LIQQANGDQYVSNLAKGIVDQTGKIEREGVVPSDPEAIAAFSKSHAPHVARVGLETGATATWL